MQESGKKLKLFLLVIILLVMSLPAITGLSGLVKEEPLNGMSIVPEAPELSWSSIADGSFQQSFEYYINEKVGFHLTMIRMRNQIWYWAFKGSGMPDAVIGKEDYLYTDGYISAYTGKDFIGDAAIHSVTEKLKAIQDTLAAHNITFIVALAPGKASAYPEFIPDRFGPHPANTNHSVMKKQFEASGINLLDFNTWFSEKRKTSKYPIYPKVGVHWTNYAALEAMDSVIKFIEQKRKIDLPSVIFKGEEWSDIPRDFDNDVGGGLNLLFPIKNYPMAYPHYAFEDTAGKAKISMMTVSDSYLRMMLTLGLDSCVMANHDYWYYNQGFEHSDGRPRSSTLDEDMKKSVMQHDVVMIMATELNYAGLSWGWINDAHRAIVLHQPIDENERSLRKLENDIRMDKKWLYLVQMKALTENIPLDSMIRRDAIYALRQGKK